MKKLLKYCFLMWYGGSMYVTFEVFFRERSHVSMFILAGLVFIIVGLLNELWDWNTSLIAQVFVGVCIATAGEFITGCIVNLSLHLNVWDYSNLPGNILGQICPQFILLWVPLILLAIILDDVIRWRFFGEEKPIYHIL